MQRGGISFTQRNQIKADEKVISSLKAISEMKMKQSMQFNLNLLVPLLAPPTAKHRDNVYYIVSEKKYEELIQVLSTFIQNESLVQLTIQCFQQVIGKGKFQEKNMAAILLDTGLVEQCLVCLQHTNRDIQTIVDVLGLFDQLFVNQQCTLKMVNKSVARDVVELIEEYSDEPELVRMSLQIMVHSSAYKQNLNALIDGQVLQSILNSQVETVKSQQLQLRILLNFSKGEEGKQVLQKDNQGIDKALSIMMKSQDSQLLETGATLLGKISSRGDLDSALCQIKEQNEQQEKALTLVNYLCLIEENQHIVVEGQIEDTLLDNVEKGEELILSQSAVILSRLLNDHNSCLVQKIVKGNVIELLNKRLCVENSLQVNTGLMQLICQITKYDGQVVVDSGLMDKVIQIVEQSINQQELLVLVNQILVRVRDVEGLEGIQLLIKIIKSNLKDKRVVELSLSNMLGLITKQTQNQQNGEVVCLIVELGQSHCESWKRACLLELQLLEVVLIHDEKSRGVVIQEMNIWHDVVISMYSNRRYGGQRQVKNWFAQKKRVGEIDVLSAGERGQQGQSGDNVLHLLFDENMVNVLIDSVYGQLVVYGQEQSEEMGLKLESQLEMLGYLLGITQYRQVMGERQVVGRLVDESKKIISCNNNGRLVLSFEHCFRHWINHNQAIESTIRGSFVNFVSSAMMNIRSDQVQVDALLSGLLSVFGNQHHMLYQHYMLKGKNQLDILVESILTLNKKYQDESIQMKSIGILRLLCDLWEIRDKVVMEGGIRFCLNCLQNVNASDSLGVSSLHLLQKIGVDNISNLNDVYQSVQTYYGTQSVKSNELSTTVQQFLSELIKANHQYFLELQQPLSDQTMNATMIQSADQLIDIESQMDTYISKLEAQASLQENVEVLNTLHIITLLADYNSQLIEKNIIGVYLDNAYQQMVLDEQQLGLTGQLAVLANSIGLVFMNLNQLIVTADHTQQLAILDQLIENQATDVFVEMIKNKNHHGEAFLRASEATVSLLNCSAYKTFNTGFLDEMINEKIPESLVEMLENCKDGQAIKACQNTLFALLLHRPQCVSLPEQALIITRVIEQIKQDDFTDGFGLLNGMKEQHLQTLLDMNVQGLVVESIKKQGIISHDQIELLKQCQGESTYEQFMVLLTNMDKIEEQDLDTMIQILTNMMNDKDLQTRVQHDVGAYKGIQDLVLRKHNAIDLLKLAIVPGQLLQEVKTFMEMTQEEQLNNGRANLHLASILLIEGYQLENDLLFKLLQVLASNVSQVQFSQQLLEYAGLLHVSLQVAEGKGVSIPDFDHQLMRTGLMEKVVHVDYLDQYIDPIFNNCACVMAKLQKDNDKMDNNQINYLHSVYDHDNQQNALFILHSIAINTVINHQDYLLLDKFNDFISKYENVQEILPLIQKVIKNVSDDHSISQIHLYNNITKFISNLSAETQYQLRVSILTYVLANNQHKDKIARQINPEEILKRVSILNENKESSQDLIDNYKLIDQLTSDNQICQTMMNKNLVEIIHESLKIEDVEVQRQVISTYNRILKAQPLYLDQMKSLIFTDTYIENINQAEQIDKIYQILSSEENLNKDIAEKIYQKILLIENVDMEVYGQKIETIEKLRAGHSQDIVTINKCFIDHMNENPEILKEEFLLDIVIDMLQKYLKSSKDCIDDDQVMNIVEQIRKVPINKEMFNKGLNSICVELLNGEKGNEQLREHISKMMVEMSAFEEVKETLRQQIQYVDELVKIIKKNNQDKSIINDQLVMMKAVYTQQKDNNILEMINEQLESGKGGEALYGVIVQLIEEQEMNEQIQEDGKVYADLESRIMMDMPLVEDQLKVLLALAGNKKMKNKKEVVERIYSQMVLLLETNDQVKAILCMDVMSVLCKNRKDNNISVNAGVADNLVKILGENNQLQESICQLIGALSYKSKEGKEAFGEVSVMSVLCNKVRTGGNGCHLLKAISINCESMEGLSAFLAEDMVKDICGMINKDNQLVMLEILSSVSVGMIGYFQRQSLIESLLGQLIDNQRQSSLVNKVLSVLDGMIRGSQEGTDSLQQVIEGIVKHSGIAIISKILLAQDNNRSIVKKALRILREVSRCPIYTCQIMDTGLDNDLIRLLVIYNEDDEVKQVCLENIKALAIDKSKGRQILDHGFLQAVEGLLIEDSDITIQIIEIVQQVQMICGVISEDIVQVIGYQLVGILGRRTDMSVMGVLDLISCVMSNSEICVEVMLQCQLLDAVNSVLIVDGYQREVVVVLKVVEILGLLLTGYDQEETSQLFSDKQIIGNIKVIRGVEGQDVRVVGEIDKLLQQLNIDPAQAMVKRHSVAIINQRLSLQNNQISGESNAPDMIKEYLATGKILNMYRDQNGVKKLMHIFLTPDMKEIICKRPKKQVFKLHWRMLVKSMGDIILHTDAKDPTFKASGFGRHKNIFRSAPNPKLCMTIVGQKDFTGKVQKFHLQFEDEREKNQFYESMNMLVTYNDNK